MVDLTFGEGDKALVLLYGYTCTKPRLMASSQRWRPQLEVSDLFLNTKLASRYRYRKLLFNFGRRNAQCDLIKEGLFVGL